MGCGHELSSVNLPYYAGSPRPPSGLYSADNSPGGCRQVWDTAAALFDQYKWWQGSLGRRCWPPFCRVQALTGPNAQAFKTCGAAGVAGVSGPTDRGAANRMWQTPGIPQHCSPRMCAPAAADYSLCWCRFALFRHPIFTETRLPPHPCTEGRKSALRISLPSLSRPPERTPPYSSRMPARSLRAPSAAAQPLNISQGSSDSPYAGCAVGEPINYGNGLCRGHAVEDNCGARAAQPNELCAPSTRSENTEQPEKITKDCAGHPHGTADIYRQGQMSSQKGHVSTFKKPYPESCSPGDPQVQRGTEGSSSCPVRPAEILNGAGCVDDEGEGPHVCATPPPANLRTKEPAPESKRARRVSFDPVPRVYEIEHEESISDPLSDS